MIKPENSYAVQQYIQMHKEDKYHKDSLISKDLDTIYGLVAGTKSETILDYGSGIGDQYYVHKKNKIFHIELKNIFCYDPAVEKFNTFPTETFDGVICTDVLEHIPEGKELDTALTSIFVLADKFVYIAVHCGLANFQLPDGTNAHCTLKHPSWWKAKIRSFNKKDIPCVQVYRTRIDGIGNAKETNENN